MNDCTHVFVRNDAVKTPLQSPYNAPYEVIKRYDICFKIKINNRTTKISIDRLKAAFIPNAEIDENNKSITTRNSNDEKKRRIQNNYQRN